MARSAPSLGLDGMCIYGPRTSHHSSPECHVPAIKVHRRPHRPGNQGHARPGDRRHRASGRRRDRSLHRALPQGSDRRAGRHAVARPRRTAGLSARTRSPPDLDPRLDPQPGQADGRTGSQDRRCHHQGGAGRHLSALQAEAPHQGRDRPRARSGTAGRSHPRRPHRRPGGSCQPPTSPPMCRM